MKLRVRRPSAIPVVFKKQKGGKKEKHYCSHADVLRASAHRVNNIPLIWPLLTPVDFYRLANRKFIMRNICIGFNFPRSSFERVNTSYTRRNLMGPDSCFPDCLSLAQSNYSLTFSARRPPPRPRVRLTRLRRRKETFPGELLCA